MITKNLAGSEVEYKEASALFQRGFDLIFNIARGFLYFNGIMLGIILLGVKADAEANSVKNIWILVMAFSALGIFGSAATIIVHMRMTLYLRWWLERTSKIEEKLGGELFTHTYQLELQGRSRWLQSYSVSLIIYALSGTAWAFLLIAAWCGDFP